MLIGYILLAIAAVEIYIGLVLLFRYQHSLATVFYGLFSISVALYAGSNGFAYVQTIFSNNAAEYLSWVGAMPIAAFLLSFSFSFPAPKRQLRELIPWIIWPLVIFIPGLLFTDLFIQHTTIPFVPGQKTSSGALLWFFLLIFGIYMVWAFRNLIVSYKTTTGYYRWLLKILIIGLILSFIVSSIFDITIPLITETNFGYIGSLFTSVWVIITGYIMLKK